jgi:hypothetical protein
MEIAHGRVLVRMENRKLVRAAEFTIRLCTAAESTTTILIRMVVAFAFATFMGAVL